jgi:pimeloyl-ACP methyl ester carboxylesterase
MNPNDQQLSTPPQLVFVHGSGGSADSWYYQTKDLRGADALTLPGHWAALALPPPPNSPPIPDQPCPSIETCADYLADYIAAKGYAAGTVVTVGHSLGGAIVLRHALRHAEQLAGLILVGTGARLRVRPDLLVALEHDYPTAVEMLIEGYFGADADPNLIRGTRRKLLRLPNTVTLNDFRLCNEFDAMSEVANIGLPALLLFGSGDPLTPPKYGEWLRDHLPNARLEIIASEGHMFPLTKPAAVNARIRGFSAELKAKREGRLNLVISS